MDDEAETYKLWRIRKTVMALSHDRGYLVGLFKDFVFFSHWIVHTLVCWICVVHVKNTYFLSSNNLASKYNNCVSLVSLKKPLLQVTQDELDQTLDQFRVAFGDKPSERRPARSDLIILVAHNDDPTDQVCSVIFPLTQYIRDFYGFFFYKTLCEAIT